MVLMEIFLFIAITSCNGFIVRPTAIAKLLLSIKIYAKTSKTTLILGLLVNSLLWEIKRRNGALSEQVSLWKKIAIRITTKLGSYLSVKKN